MSVFLEYELDMSKFDHKKLIPRGCAVKLSFMAVFKSKFLCHFRDGNSAFSLSC